MLSIEERFSASLKKAIFEHDLQPRLALAVSGGIDSMALLTLAHYWSKQNAAKLIVISVDHGLRVDSAQDCKFVYDFCLQLGLECYILKWSEGSSFNSGLQAKARQARYDLMCNLCKELDIIYLCTGHHKDDCAENFFLRLSKGQGPLSLFMREVWFFNNLMIVRPLLQVSKEECKAYLVSKGIPWKEDPSNAAFTFTRNRLRHALSSCDPIHPGKFTGGLFDFNKVFETQRRIANLSSIFQEKLFDAYSRGVLFFKLGFARIDIGILKKLNSELANMLLSSILTTIRGNAKVPRYDGVSRILSSLPSLSAATLHGCKLVRVKDKLLIFRIFGRDTPKEQNVFNGSRWDDRFLVRCSAICSQYRISTIKTQELKSLNRNGLGLEKLNVANSILEEIISSLPVIRSSLSGGLAFCPLLEQSQICKEEALKEVSVEFSPTFFSATKDLAC